MNGPEVAKTARKVMGAPLGEMDAGIEGVEVAGIDTKGAASECVTAKFPLGLSPGSSASREQ